MENQLEEFRRQPPPPLAPRPLNLPIPEEFTLANGLRVVMVESKRVPLVSFRLALRTGDVDDPPELPGLTDILTHMMTEGTTSRTSRQIADDVARLGASLSAGSSSDYTTVAASSLAQYTDQILELLADVTLHPSFPDDELELTKQNVQQNLIAQRAQASFLGTEMVSRIIYGRHPYAVVSPTPESIEAMQREKLAEFHQALMLPNNSVLFAVGDFQQARLLERINELFGEWRPGEPLERSFPPPPERSRRTLHIVDRPGSAQSNIIIAHLAIPRRHPDFFPMLLMHTVLGATASSRLFMNLREDKGYTYGAYSSLDVRQSAGSFRATAEVRTAVTGDALREFFYELERIRTEDVSVKELHDAKSYLTGVFPIRLETQEGLVEQLVQIKMHGLPPDHMQNYRDRINEVTREEVRRVAQAHVRPDQAAIVLVGDATVLADQVSSYASIVEIYDNAGHRQEVRDKALTTSESAHHQS